METSQDSLHKDILSCQHFQVPRFQFECIDLAITNYLATGQSAGRIGVGTRTAALTPLVNLSFLFLSHVSRHFIDFVAIAS